MIRLTKMDAARRQLEVAAALFVSRGEPLAIHTLSGAAEEILGKLAERAGQRSVFEGMRVAAEERSARAVSTSELARLVNKSRDSLKHANHPHEDPYDYDLDDAVVMLFRAMVNYQLVTGVLTGDMERALAVLRREYPALFLTAA